MAKSALEEELPILTDGVDAGRYGWVVEMDWESGLCHVQLTALRKMGDAQQSDPYMLELSFEFYPIEQPGVRFVNPETREIGAADQFERWWPNVDGNPWINIQINQQDPAKSYLCFQWTNEFRQTHAKPADDDPKRWDPEKHSVVGVVRTVQRALRSEHYKGYRKQ